MESSLLSPLEFLMAWYQSRCNGEWEHRYGVEIGSLDNPGWLLKVDLVGTDRDGVDLEEQRVDRSATDWLTWWSDGRQFNVACGAANLEEAILKFQEFAQGPQRAS